jgi:hypothetical protein
MGTTADGRATVGRRALIVLDVIDDFSHRDGDALLAAARELDAARRGLGTGVLPGACVPLDAALGDLALDALERLTGVRVIDVLPATPAPGPG